MNCASYKGKLLDYPVHKGICKLLKSVLYRSQENPVTQNIVIRWVRDLPRYVSLIEKGVIDVKSMITDTFPLERTREAIQKVADRTTISAVITFA